MSTGGACRGGSGIRAFSAGADGNITGGEIDNCGGDKERGNAARSMFEQVLVLALDDFKAADAAADVDTHTLGVFFGDFESGRLQRVFGSRDRKMDKTTHLLDLFFLDEARGIEVLDLARDAAIEQRRIERFDNGNAVPALKQRLPGLFGVVSNGREQTDAGDYDSAGNNSLLLRLGSRAQQERATQMIVPSMPRLGRWLHITGLRREAIFSYSRCR